MDKNKIIGIIVTIVIALAIIGACSSSSDDGDYTARDLQEAKGRYFSGNASKSDKIMVEGFYKWKANQ